MTQIETNQVRMYLKFKNLKRKVNSNFVVSASGANHLFEDKNMKYLGKCDEVGNITVSADQDEEWQKKSLEQQLAEVKSNVQKKTARTVLRRGKGDDDLNDGPEDNQQETYNEQDDDLND